MKFKDKNDLMLKRKDKREALFSYPCMHFKKCLFFKKKLNFLNIKLIINLKYLINWWRIL